MGICNKNSKFGPIILLFMKASYMTCIQFCSVIWILICLPHFFLLNFKTSSVCWLPSLRFLVLFSISEILVICPCSSACSFYYVGFYPSKITITSLYFANQRLCGTPGMTMDWQGAPASPSSYTVKRILRLEIPVGTFPNVSFYISSSSTTEFF